MKVLNTLATLSVAIVGMMIAAPGLAATKAEIDKRVTTTMSEFDSLHAGNAKLVKKSAGVLVFPRVTKGGAGVAAEHGEGVLQVDGKTVGYYSIGAASVGLTLGVANHSEVIMFMNQESLDKFTKSDGWSMGGDAEVTVVSKSADSEYDSMTNDKPILAFGFAEKGLIADLSMDGTKISKLKK
jgi:lipid-binding SYLF domain-containing protein